MKAWAIEWRFELGFFALCSALLFTSWMVGDRFDNIRRPKTPPEHVNADRSKFWPDEEVNAKAEADGVPTTVRVYIVEQVTGVRFRVVFFNGQPINVSDRLEETLGSVKNIKKHVLDPAGAQ